MSRIPGNIPILFPLIFLSLFFIIPMVSILQTGLQNDEGDLSLTHVGEVVNNSYYRHVIGFTIEQALYSALTTMALGLPAAYLLTKHQFPGKSAIRALLTVPFVLPTITVAMGFILLFGKFGLVNDLLALFWTRQSILYNLPSIVLAHTFFNFAIVVRLVGTSWAGMDPKLEQAAESLGAPPHRRFLHVTLPHLLPAILGSFILTFMYCFMSFTIVLVLGGPTLTTLEVAIYTESSVIFNREMASALAIVQLCFTIFFLYLYTHISSKLPDISPLSSVPNGKSTHIIRTKSTGRSVLATFTSSPLADLRSSGSTASCHSIPPLHPRNRLRAFFGKGIPSFRTLPRKIAIFLYIVIIALVIIGPVFEVVRHSLIVDGEGGESYSFDRYRELWNAEGSPANVSPIDATINSLFFAFMTVMLAVPLGTIIAYVLHGRSFKGKNILTAIFMLPLGISAITLALGLIRGYSTGFLSMRGSWYWIVIAHTILAYPFVMRSVSSSLKGFNPTQRDAAMSLGASRMVSFFRVELPQILPGIIVGAIFALAISVGELGATYMLYKPEYATLPMVIFRYIGIRDYGMGSAVSVVLMLIVFLDRKSVV